MKIKVAMALFAVLWIGACEKYVDFDIPPHESKLVLNSLFTHDSLFCVRMSRSISSEAGDIPVVDNAVVCLYQNGQAVDTLRGEGDGFYYSNVKAQQGSEYTIKAFSEKYPEVSASDGLPETPKSFSVSEPEVVLASDNLYKLTLTFEDDGASGDYYEVCFQQFFREYEVYPPWEEEPEEPEYEYVLRNLGIYSYDPLIRDEGLEDGTFSSLVFSDRSINGAKKELEIFFYPANYSFVGGDDDGELFIHLRKISQNYYNFMLSWYESYDSSDDFLNVNADPFIMYNNVENGYGIFAGYSEVIDTTKVFYKTYDY